MPAWAVGPAGAARAPLAAIRFLSLAPLASLEITSGPQAATGAWTLIAKLVGALGPVGSQPTSWRVSTPRLRRGRRVRAQVDQPCTRTRRTRREQRRRGEAMRSRSCPTTGASWGIRRLQPTADGSPILDGVGAYVGAFRRQRASHVGAVGSAHDEDEDEEDDLGGCTYSSAVVPHQLHIHSTTHCQIGTRVLVYLYSTAFCAADKPASGCVCSSVCSHRESEKKDAPQGGP